MKHLTDEQLSARLDGELPAKQAAAVERHLGECAACRERLAALAGADASLARALERDPGEAYFASFADRVQARMASGAAADSREAPADAPPARPSWFSRPATLAWAGATASLVLVGVFALRTALQEPAGSRLVAQRPAVTDADRLQPRAAAPGETKGFASGAESASPKQSAPGASVPPAGEHEMLDATQDRAPAESREGAAASGLAANEPDRRQALAPPSRLQEVRTLPSGEQVPVQRRALPGAEQRKSFAVPPADASKFRKPLAQPMTPAKDLQKVVTQQEEVARASGAAEEIAVRGGAAPAPATAPPVAKASKTLAAAPAPQSATTPAPEAGNFARDEARGIGLRRVCGTVQNAQGRPVEGATVILVGSGRTTRTGAGGDFCVDAPAEGGMLAVIALGYEEHREPLPADGPVAIALRSVDTVGRDDTPVARLKTELPPATAAESSRAARPDWGRGAYFFNPPGSPSPSASVAPAPVAPTAGTARAASEVARLAKRAPLWAKAGEMWTAVAVAAKTDAEADEARWQAADARMNAWRLAPIGRNRVEALGAVNDYLSKAPAGARRDAAEGWKRELPLR